MLRKMSGCSLILLLLTAATPAAEGDKEVKALIAKAVEAHGGAANLAKYKATTSKFKGKVHVGAMDIDVTGTVQVQEPEKLHLDMQLDVAGNKIDIVQVHADGKGWIAAGGKTMDMNKEMLAEAREQFHAGKVSGMRGLDDKDIKLSALGEIKVGGKLALGVRVSREGFRDVNLYFDKDKGLLLKSETRGKDVQGGGEEYTEEKMYADYKKVGDLVMPHKVTALRDGKPFLETEITEVTPAEKLDDNLFAKP